MSTAGSVLVKHFTRFTKDIFAGFVATVFIYEALLQTFGVRSGADSKNLTIHTQ
jgi:hypothetical protein